MTWAKRAAANDLFAVRSSVGGSRESTVRSTAVAGAVADGKYEKKVLYGFAVKESAVDIRVPTGVKIEKTR